MLKNITFLLFTYANAYIKIKNVREVWDKIKNSNFSTNMRKLFMIITNMILKEGEIHNVN